ncbi:MAG: hypothetical protein Q8M15_17030 [Bacteroidota bacterium]|nr:hypothetical protein [Bacteroidota bacterium]
MAKIIYTHENLGLFFGFISTSYENAVELFENEIVKTFKNYKTELSNHLYDWDEDGIHRNYFESADLPDGCDYKTLKRQFINGFYVPRAFCLMGKWDIVVLSLIEDFEFADHYFHPFSPKAKSDEDITPYIEKSFRYQILTGIMPHLREEDDKKKEERDYNLYSFLVEDPEEKIYKNIQGVNLFKENSAIHPLDNPLIGLASLKINNLLKIGNSFELFKLIQFAIEKYCDHYKGQSDKSTRFMLLETTSWHELQLVLFSDSYKSIANILQRVKNLTLKDIFDISEIKVDKKMYRETLWYKCGMRDINGINIFSKAVFNLGFDCQLLKNMQIEGCKTYNQVLNNLNSSILDSDEGIKLLQRWFVKPGHSKTVINLLNKGKGSQIKSHTYGPGEFSKIYRKLSSRKTVARVIHSIILNKQINKDQFYTENTFSIPEIEFDSNSDNIGVVAKGYKRIHHRLNYMQFTQDEFDNLRAHFKKIGVSKILTSKIHNLFANFNESIRDHIMYSYFIELRPGFEKLYNYIIDYSNCKAKPITLKAFQNILYLNTDELQMAYINRFQQSHSLFEITDHNLEFKGGIHQLVSSYDAAYKIYSNVIGGPGGFTYVSVDSNVTSTQYAVRLNYNHLYQPEIFFSILAHEAANQYVSRFSSSSDLYRALRHIQINDDLNLSKIIDKEQASDIYRYFIVDMLTFITGYRRDFESFIKWHFHNTFQINDSYSTPRQLNHSVIEFHYIRMRNVALILDLNGISSEFQLSLNNYIKGINLDKYTLHIDVFYNSMEQQRIEMINNLWESLSSTLRIVDQIGLNDDVEKFEDILSGYVKNKRSVHYDAINYLSHVCTKRIFCDHLKNSKLNVLIRDEITGKPVKSSEDFDIDYFFDPRGGLFTFKPWIRRKHFRHTTTLMRDLWALGNAMKLSYFSKFIKQKDVLNFHKCANNEKEIVSFLSATDLNGEGIFDFIINKLSSEIKLECYFYKNKLKDQQQYILRLNLLNEIKKVINTYGLFLIEYSNESFRSLICLWEVFMIHKLLKERCFKFDNEWVVLFITNDSCFDDLKNLTYKVAESIVHICDERISGYDLKLGEFIDDIIDTNGQIKGEFKEAISEFIRQKDRFSIATRRDAKVLSEHIKKKRLT